ncbi:M55 family metallopeptidase [Sporosarcina sp. HYO08]|uniref:M55 family metallopeptidase n=1 Tax=Sporosarcina sp. HYO08 TaxID=1759557 RepID=UPI000795141A|nr:M55 family metallopeptidase [Sporosarcina sp. HYO08]KXH84077.1 peptidase M55 [Sporosarcina sp. HYO08]
MKIFISADIEGVSGIVHGEHTARDGREHDYARKLMTEEVNACVLGALDAGAKEIIVNDSHGTMRNIFHEDLHPKAALISGSPKKLAMMEGLSDDFDAAICIGYHTMMGSNGILNHTFNGRVVKSIEINGQAFGEFGLNALVAGYFNVPTILVSGCDLVAQEAAACISNIHTIEVKQTINRTTALNKHPIVARELIKKGTTQAIKGRNDVPPFKIEPPYSVKISFLHTGLADAVEILPMVQRVDPLTISFVMRDFLDCYRMIRSTIMMAGAVQ